MRSSIKLDRLNRLMGLLYSGKPVPKNIIMDSLGYATSRTFERDLAFLREAYAVDITFDMIIEAIGKKQCLRFAYASPYSSQKATERTVSPWGIFFQSHAWYLWGSHAKLPRGATYRISRITCPHPWPEAPWIPHPEGTSLYQHASSGWYGYTGDAAIPVEIAIDQPERAGTQSPGAQKQRLTQKAKALRKSSDTKRSPKSKRLLPVVYSFQ